MAFEREITAHEAALAAERHINFNATLEVKCGCTTFDFNPIEQLFAKLKSFLRKVKARTVAQLWKTIALSLKIVSKSESKAYLANSGYS